MELKVKEKAVGELEKIVGKEFVSTSAADLYCYSQDMTENEPSWPDIVVMPGSVEEVQGVLRLATREKIPVVPFVAGANIGGLTIPLKGGIELDLRRMDRILEVNEREMYAIVEPGATYGHLRRCLDKNHPQLWYSFPFSPPFTSMTANALLQGMGDLGTVLGHNADCITGLEVVLPTGEVVKVGSCAVSDSWFNRAPLPDIAGLFIGWQGATGVVTKMGLQLWPKPKCVDATRLMIYDMGATFRLSWRLASMRGLVDDITMVPFEYAKVIALRTTKPPERVPGEPEWVMTIIITANSENELKAKLELRDEIINEELKDTKVDIDATAPYDLPISGSIEFAGGCTWVGTYGPTSRWEEMTPKVFQLLDKYGLPRGGFFRPMRGGHFGMWRPIVGIDKGDPEQVERVRKFMPEALALALNYGHVPYKTPHWAIQEMVKRADPNFVELLRRVKKMLDPSNIMNPGRWGAPEE